MPDVAVHAAGSAREALTSLQQGLRPDIVLLDIWLNDGTGFDAMQSFKTVIPGARFIFMSAEATPRDRRPRPRAVGLRLRRQAP
ncbi:hypothetical protein AEMCBJ_15765 [Cupriavidus necator]